MGVAVVGVMVGGGSRGIFGGAALGLAVIGMETDGGVFGAGAGFGLRVCSVLMGMIIMVVVVF